MPEMQTCKNCSLVLTLIVLVHSLTLERSVGQISKWLNNFQAVFTSSYYKNITIYVYYGEDWVPTIRVPKGNTRTKTKFWVWVGLGLCLNFIGIFGLGTYKVQNFGFLGSWYPRVEI